MLNGGHAGSFRRSAAVNHASLQNIRTIDASALSPKADTMSLRMMNKVAPLVLPKIDNTIKSNMISQRRRNNDDSSV